jgi:hypothetical protein
VVEVLEAEMKAKRLNVLGYVQELLLRRYEALRGRRPRLPKSPAVGGRRSR